MSTLKTCRCENGRLQRTVYRRESARALSGVSPFIEQDPNGQRQLAGLGIIPLVPAAAGAFKIVQALPIIKGLFSHHQSAWDKYRKGNYGKIQGSQMPTQDYQAIFDRMIQEDKPKCFPPYRLTSDPAQMQALITDQVAQAIVAGKVTGSDNARSIFDKVIVPWWNSIFAQWNAVNTKPCNAEHDTNRFALAQMTIDTIDRLITNQPLRQGAPPNALEQRLQALRPAPPPAAAAPVSKPPVTIQPVTPANPVNSAAAPAQPVASASTPSSVEALIKQVLDSGASQQQAYLAAMQALQAQGAPITPAVQQAVAQDVKEASMGSGLPPWAGYAALGAGALILFFTMARPAKRGRA